MRCVANGQVLAECFQLLWQVDPTPLPHLIQSVYNLQRVHMHALAKLQSWRAAGYRV